MFKYNETLHTFSPLGFVPGISRGYMKLRHTIDTALEQETLVLELVMKLLKINLDTLKIDVQQVILIRIKPQVKYLKQLVY